MKIIKVEDYREKIEKDLEWRLDEIAFFSNQINNFRLRNISLSEKERVEKEKCKYRKLLVLILYSHFEGFFRFSFETYAQAINSAEINVEEANLILSASNLHIVFNNYDSASLRAEEDSNSLNKANKKHKNRLKLIEGLNKSMSSKINLPLGIMLPKNRTGL